MGKRHRVSRHTLKSMQASNIPIPRVPPTNRNTLHQQRSRSQTVNLPQQRPPARPPTKQINSTFLPPSMTLDEPRSTNSTLTRGFTGQFSFQNAPTLKAKQTIANQNLSITSESVRPNISRRILTSPQRSPVSTLPSSQGVYERAGVVSAASFTSGSSSTHLVSPARERGLSPDGARSGRDANSVYSSSATSSSGGVVDEVQTSTPKGSPNAGETKPIKSKDWFRKSFRFPDMKPRKKDSAPARPSRQPIACQSPPQNGEKHFDNASLCDQSSNSNSSNSADQYAQLHNKQSSEANSVTNDSGISTFIPAPERDEVLMARLEAVESQRQLDFAREEILRLRSGTDAVPPAGTLARKQKKSKKAVANTRSVTIVLNENHPIGTIEIATDTRWPELDQLTAKVLDTYASRIDPDFSLGISSKRCLNFYQLGEVTRYYSSHNPQPEFLPYGYLVGAVESINLQIGSSESSEFFFSSIRSLVPLAFLKRYACDLLENQAAIITGTEKSGKMHIAREISLYLAQGQFSQVIELDATGQEFGTFVGILRNSLSIGDVKVVLISALEMFDSGNLADIENAFKQIAAICQQSIPGCYIISTLTTHRLTSTTCQPHSVPAASYLKTISLSNLAQPACGLLGRYINREIMLNPCQSVETLALHTFLPKFTGQLNNFLYELTRNQSLTIGAGVYIQAVLDSESANHTTAFATLWNNTIRPFVRRVIGQHWPTFKARFKNEAHTRSLLEFSLLPSDLDQTLRAAGLLPIQVETLTGPGEEPSPLSEIAPAMPLFESDDEVIDITGVKPRGPETPPTAPSVTNYDNLEDSSDPLADMLAKLQEAVKGTTCYDSESEESVIGTTAQKFNGLCVDEVQFK